MDVIPPDPPWNRIERFGDAWGEEWRRAWIAMARYDRIPSLHVIDSLFEKPWRAWMSGSFGEIAALTAAGGKRQWTGWVPNRATVGAWQTRVVVILDEDDGTIVTVF